MFKGRISQRLSIIIVGSIVIGTMIIYGFLIMKLVQFDDSMLNRRVGYAITSPEDLSELRNLNSFDENQIFIEGEELVKEHNAQLDNIRLYITNLFISIIGLTTLIFTMYYMHVKDRGQRLSNEIKTEVEKSDFLVEKQNHDLKLINEYLTHELKNSLSVLQAKVYLQNEDTIDYIAKMSSQIDDINALIEPEVNLESGFMVDDLIYALETEVDSRTKFNYDEFLTIKGSDLLIERALYNIISNGFKYGADQVIVSFSKIKDNVVICIENNGPEISKQQLDKIFRMHYRINELNIDGSGIGLALVKNIVDIHHGSIYVESNEQKTSFYLSFKAFDIEEQDV